jgi:hypothetical protein
VSTGEDMFRGFKETAPTDAMIMEIDRPASVRRLMEKLHNIATMHLRCDTFLRLASSSTVSQLVEEIFEPEIYSRVKLISIVFEREFRLVDPWCKNTTVFILMAFRTMPIANIDAPVSQRRLNSVPRGPFIETILHTSRGACGYAVHNILTWPMSFTKALKSFI